MDHLQKLRKAFCSKPLDFYFGPDDPHFKEIQEFQKDQMRLLHDKPSLIERPKGAASETFLHSRRVADDVYMFAIFIGLSDQIARNLHWAVLLHDIGKLDIPVEILDKPGKLNADEIEEMRKHTEYGYKRIKALNIKHPLLKLAADVAKYHHERHDGKGYYGLKGRDIPYRIRMIQLCDIFDAVSMPRAYRSAKEQMTPLETVKNILDVNGLLYSAVDQRFAIPYCLLKVNILEGNLNTEQYKKIEHYLLDVAPFTDEEFWPSPTLIPDLD